MGHLFPAVLFPRAALTKYNKLGGLNNRNFIVSVLGPRSPRCWQDGSFEGYKGKTVPYTSPHFWRFDGKLWHLCLPDVSQRSLLSYHRALFLCSYPCLNFFFDTDTSHIWLESTQLPYNRILTELIASAMTLFLNKATVWGTGDKDVNMCVHLGDNIQPTMSSFKPSEEVCFMRFR